MNMKKTLFLLSTFICASALCIGQGYFPSKNQWLRKQAQELGMNPIRIQAAIDTAIAHQSTDNRDLEIHHYLTFGREPFGDALGPHKSRGGQTGLIIKDGYIVAEWGDPQRVDLTFSVSKSFLSATVGILYDNKTIPDINAPVGEMMAPIFPIDTRYGPSRAEKLGTSAILEPFTSEHNSRITWDHLLRQTSDWEGTLWGKPDWADRPSGAKETWISRERHTPGTVWEYNDTRVNLLALAATNMARRPLQDVLRENIMDPIGASTTWRWMGYNNSWIVLDGKAVEVPSGGAHWGGGMFINAFDQARFGLLTLHRGLWDQRRILSEEWIANSLSPTPAKPDYGYMNWFLNTEGEMPSAPDNAFYHLGAGSNIIYVDPTNNLVVVCRWIDRAAMDLVIKEILSSF